MQHLVCDLNNGYFYYSLQKTNFSDANSFYFSLNAYCFNTLNSSDTVLRLNGWRADGQLTSETDVSQNPAVPRPSIPLRSHNPKFHWLGIFEIWEYSTIS
jgi:hypothetical protein